MKTRVVLLVVALLVPTVTSAQTLRTEASLHAESQRRVERWKGSLRAIDQLLVKEKSTKAYKKVSNLLGEMTDAIVSGEGVAPLLSTALVLRAIAAVQMGEREEGLWHWHVAQQMFPTSADYEMTAYGEVGDFLKANPARPADLSGPDSSEELKGLQVPKKLKAPKPDFPRAKLGAEPVKVAVQAVVGEDGRVRKPAILEAAGELTLVCRALDAFRLWEFEPARLDGEPVAALYNLSINFVTMKRP